MVVVCSRRRETGCKKVPDICEWNGTACVPKALPAPAPAPPAPPAPPPGLPLWDIAWVNDAGTVQELWAYLCYAVAKVARANGSKSCTVRSGELAKDIRPGKSYAVSEKIIRVNVEKDARAALQRLTRDMPRAMPSLELSCPDEWGLSPLVESILTKGQAMDVTPDGDTKPTVKNPCGGGNTDAPLQEMYFVRECMKTKQQVKAYANDTCVVIAVLDTNRSQLAKLLLTPVVVGGTAAQWEDAAKRHRLKLFSPATYASVAPKDISRAGKQSRYYSPSEIRRAYVSTQGSGELNMSLIYYMREREEVAPDIFQRAVTLMDEYLKMANARAFAPLDKDVVVYHGTSQLIHSTLSNTGVIETFFSTTRDISIAREYAGRFQGVIYMLHLPAGFPLINFNDGLRQVLLPPGVSYKITRTHVHQGYTYVFADVQPYHLPNLHLYRQVFAAPCPLPSKIKYPKRHASPLLFAMPPKKRVTGINPGGSSVFYQTTVKGVEYYLKDIVKRNNRIRANASDTQVFKRVLNEVVAGRIYEDVYGLKTIPMQVCINRGELQGASRFLLTSKKTTVLYSSLDPSRYADMLSGFLVDCVMANWDVYNNDNIGVLARGGVIRTDVGGSLLFRGLGDEHMQFRPGVTPNEHATISNQTSFAQLLKRATKHKNQIAPRMRALMEGVDSGLEEGVHRVVERVYTDLVKPIKQTALRDRYMAMLSNIADTVVYRHRYYMSHMDEVIESVTKRVMRGGDAPDPSLPPIADPVATTSVHEHEQRLQELVELSQRCSIRPKEKI